MSTTGWVLIWVALVVAALMFYGLIGLFLFRKAARVLTQAQDSTEVFDAFTQALDGIEVTPFKTAPDLAADEEQKSAWRRTRRINRIRRSKRRLARRRRTYQRWKEMPFSTSKA